MEEETVKSVFESVLSKPEWVGKTCLLDESKKMAFTPSSPVEVKSNSMDEYLEI